MKLADSQEEILSRKVEGDKKKLFPTFVSSAKTPTAASFTSWLQQTVSSDQVAFLPPRWKVVFYPELLLSFLAKTPFFHFAPESFPDLFRNFFQEFVRRKRKSAKNSCAASKDLATLPKKPDHPGEEEAKKRPKVRPHFTTGYCSCDKIIQAIWQWHIKIYPKLHSYLKGF